MKPLTGGAPHPLRAGSHILEEELARGGFGVVYRARHAHTAAPAAVKVLHASDRIAVARFAREIEIVLALAHPHVCAIIEHGLLDDGRPHYAMELLSGATLAEHLAARGRLPVEEAIAILTPIASALDAAHERGIVHRDLKPSNVFLADERAMGRVVLLDFGVAKLRDASTALTGSRDTVGTILYMAPEQLAGRRVDARADVYALGALAYALLTGRPPFGGSAGPVLRQIHGSARPTAPSTAAPLDPNLDGPILRALDRDPQARFASAGAFVSALREAAAGLAEPVLPEGSIARAAIAVYAEVRANHAGGELDEPTLAALESALPIVSSALSDEGLDVVLESASRLLLLGLSSNDSASVRRILDAAVRAHHRFVTESSGAVTLGIVVHAGVIPVSPEGTLLDGGLLHLASWAPPSPSGVIVSDAVRAGLGMTFDPVPGAPAYSFLVR
ncbi:Serine/threonine protein kinase [Minicystis rosea]|nr:Serine/threonine protein kinase [Minicystis rosea]